MNQDNTLGMLFYAPLFIALGIGLKLGEKIGTEVNGFYFIGLGFILLIIAVIFQQKENKK